MSLNVTVATISMFQEGKISHSQIKRETNKDLTLVKLAKVVQTGWRDQCAEIDPDLHTFWIRHWNLSIMDGVIMNGTRIVSHGPYEMNISNVCVQVTLEYPSVEPE